MLNNKSFLSSTILYSIGEIIPRILSFILLPVLTVYLTTQEYGINSYTTSVMMFVSVLASLSLNTYLLSQFYKEEGVKNRKKLVGTIFCTVMLFNILVLVLQLLFFPTLIKAFEINIPFYPFFILAILNNFFDVMGIIPLALYRVNQDVKGFLAVSLSRTLLQYLLVLIFVVYFKWGLEGSYYGRLYVNIPYVFIYLYYINKNGYFKIDYSILKKALKFCLPLLPGSVSYILISLSDRIILERYISLDALGIYSVAFTLALVLNIIIQAFYKTIEPILFKEYAGSNFIAVNSLLYKSYLSVIIMGAFGVAIFSKEIFMIAASKNFLVGYKIVPLLVTSVAISGINIYLDMLLITENKQKIVSYTTILSGVISIIINLILIPIFGYYGAIIASISSFLTVNVICQFSLKIEKRFIFPQVILIILVALIPYLYDTLIPLRGILSNIMLKLVLFIVFALITAKWFYINVNQLKTKLINPSR